MDLRSFIEKVNSRNPFEGDLKFDEQMSGHTSFKTGGKADLWVRPTKSVFPTWTGALLKAARAEGIPVFILGGGANLLVSDKGIRGIVLDTGAYDNIKPRSDAENPHTSLRAVCRKEWIETPPSGGERHPCGFSAWTNAVRSSAKAVETAASRGEPSSLRDSVEYTMPPEAEKGEGSLFVKALSGTSIDSMTQKLADQGLSGLEFLAGMPGTVGGAVWMNARCYGKSVSDVLEETQILDENFDTVTVPFCEKEFSYKKSPFQNRSVLILAAVFRVSIRNTNDIQTEMSGYKKDREEKGHYRYPSAGSVFKNNPAFGAPAGKIIADLGLRGLSRGGAQLSSWHGNIIINKGEACSEDIRFLIDEIMRRVKEEKGFDLEPEIIFAGEW
ncbi:MAG: UDP-N-acetylmuramate dehydrogenase [Treponema sp.]|jgi:UDP-N-acetylmuramate dehydrogenase|nr:UDP-N-acetylmuramate dehydrogenase [Treponema sp.]